MTSPYFDNFFDLGRFSTNHLKRDESMCFRGLLVRFAERQPTGPGSRPGQDAIRAVNHGFVARTTACAKGSLSPSARFTGASAIRPNFSISIGYQCCWAIQSETSSCWPAARCLPFLARHFSRSLDFRPWYEHAVFGSLQQTRLAPRLCVLDRRSDSPFRQRTSVSRPQAGVHHCLQTNTESDPLELGRPAQA